MDISANYKMMYTIWQKKPFGIYIQKKINNTYFYYYHYNLQPKA